jgi:NitT/TauT family transport system permease protein
MFGRAAKGVALGLGFPIAMLALWEALAQARVIPIPLFSQPSAIFAQLGPSLESGALQRDVRTTLVEFAVGYVVAAVPGLLIGFAMGLWRRVDYVLEPIVIGLYTAPTIALYPLLILWLGLGFASVITLVVLFTIFPIIVNTALGVRLVDPVLVRSAVSFGASRREVLQKVVLPAALPSIVSGLQLAVGRCFTGAVVAELFIGSAGLGYSIGYYASFLQMDAVFFNIFVVGILGVSATLAMGALEQRVRYEA